MNHLARWVVFCRIARWYAHCSLHLANLSGNPEWLERAREDFRYWDGELSLAKVQYHAVFN